MKDLFILVVLAALIVTGCTLRLGGPDKLTEKPAPTSLPLAAITEPVQSARVIPPPEPVQLPAGFTITVSAQDLNGPRMLAGGPDKHLYVAERGAGRVGRLPGLSGGG